MLTYWYGSLLPTILPHMYICTHQQDRRRYRLPHMVSMHTHSRLWFKKVENTSISYLLAHLFNYADIHMTVEEVASNCVLLPPANEVCEGYVFTPVCHSVHRGCIPACNGSDTPQEDTPKDDTPPGRNQEDTPPRPEDTHPGRNQEDPPRKTDHPWSSACWEIRATSGRYASYWNAYLSLLNTDGPQVVLLLARLESAHQIWGNVLTVVW